MSHGMSHVAVEMLVNTVVAFRHRRNRELLVCIYCMGILASSVDLLSLFMTNFFHVVTALPKVLRPNLPKPPVSPQPLYCRW